MDDEPEEIELTDEMIAEQLKPFFEEIDRDYEAAFEPLAEEFRKKGPEEAPPEPS